MKRWSGRFICSGRPIKYARVLNDSLGIQDYGMKNTQGQPVKKLKSSNAPFANAAHVIASSYYTRQICTESLEALDSYHSEKWYADHG